MAADQSSYYLGAGLLSENMSKYASSPSDDTTSLTDTEYFNLMVQARYDLGGGLGFAPAISYTPLGIKSADGGEKDRILAILARFSYDLGSLDINSGPGLVHKMISASGGTTTLDNGTGTSTFALPPNNQSMNLLEWSVGVGTSFSGFRADLDFIVTDTFSSRRAVDGLGTLSYGLF